MAEKQYSAAQMVIDTLKNNGVEYVFGIPGAKIDYLFNALEDDDIELVVTRHEQNAAMIAQGIGRLTGKPGVAITTSGPGVSNLTTGLLTATSEGDPVLAIGGQVKRNDLLRLTHQSIDNASLLRSSTKYSAEVQDPESLSEVITNAMRTATSGKMERALSVFHKMLFHHLSKLMQFHYVKTTSWYLQNKKLMK